MSVSFKERYTSVAPELPIHDMTDLQNLSHENEDEILIIHN